MPREKIFIAHSWTGVGLNIQSISVAKAASANYDITYLTQARIGSPKLQYNDHLQIHEWPNKRPGKWEDFLFLFKLIRKKRPQVLIVHFGATNICMIVSWLMRVQNRICWMHTLSSQFFLDSASKKKGKRSFIYRKLAYRMATHIIVQNDSAKIDAINNFSITPGKIHKIYNGIIQNAKPVLYENKIKSIRYSGRLAKSKGIDIMLEAFNIAYKKNKNILLEIAGYGNEEEQNLKAFIKNEQLEQAIIFHGYLSSYEEAVQFIGNAYCLLLPSRTDNFPTVVLEALSLGIPIIASDTGGIPEMFENEKEGFLVPMENADAFASAIVKMASDENVRNEMSKEARQTYLHKFSMDQHVHNVIKFIGQLNRGS